MARSGQSSGERGCEGVGARSQAQGGRLEESGVAESQRIAGKPARVAQDRAQVRVAAGGTVSRFMRWYLVRMQCNGGGNM